MLSTLSLLTPGHVRNEAFNATQPVGLGKGRKGVIVLRFGFVFQPAIHERADFRLGLAQFLELIRQSQLGRGEHSVSRLWRNSLPWCRTRAKNTPLGTYCIKHGTFGE